MGNFWDLVKVGRGEYLRRPEITKSERRPLSPRSEIPKPGRRPHPPRSKIPKPERRSTQPRSKILKPERRSHPRRPPQTQLHQSQPKKPEQAFPLTLVPKLYKRSFLNFSPDNLAFRY